MKIKELEKLYSDKLNFLYTRRPDLLQYEDFSTDGYAAHFYREFLENIRK